MNNTAVPSLPRRTTGSEHFGETLYSRLSRQEVPAHLRSVHGIQITTATLAKLACRGGGPPYQKFGRKPLYPVHLLDEWAVQRLGPIVQNTSQSTYNNEVRAHRRSHA